MKKDRKIDSIEREEALLWVVGQGDAYLRLIKAGSAEVAVKAYCDVDPPWFGTQKITVYAATVSATYIVEVSELAEVEQDEIIETTNETRIN